LFLLTDIIDVPGPKSGNQGVAPTVKNSDGVAQARSSHTVPLDASAELSLAPTTARALVLEGKDNN
jgi:hypothetical protein